jgi:ATP-dependent DNA helicase RecQ
MTPDLLIPLKRFFGYAAFKPHQEAIIRDVLAGRDVVALLPTGGGKSLCYQLPALIRPGLTLVVSPLIALMKDQVDALTAAGVKATLLNSTVDPETARDRISALQSGYFRLLYVAPERLMQAGFLEQLSGWPVSAFAVDEAHCISEWGHDFRPEYRQLAKVRERFPKVPMLALTATATERVRDDIAKSLRMRDPARHVGSFNRPNLTYTVVEKADAYEQLVKFVKARPKQSGIVYGLSRNTAEVNADRLRSDGIRAVAYHAGLDATARDRAQEAFIRDEADVVCATIAFGMGINKPNVRFVVHYDLPKHVEGYYQETGRAGRDGLPSDCLLLFNAGDAMRLKKFAEDITDDRERAHVLKKLDDMVHFAESHECRRAAILAYFGEELDTDCTGCDNCQAPRERYDGTVHAQKLMSCVYRIREKANFGVGLNHVVDVLVGADTEKIRGWGHNTLSTYGIGKDLPKSAWKAAGRELIRLGLMKQDAAKFNVLELTPAGLAALKERKAVALTRQPDRVETKSRDGAAAMPCDEALFETLRVLRKRLADQRDVPAYIIFSDVALRHMARIYPTDSEAFLRVSGVGEKKLADFGDEFLAAIRTHVAAHARQSFAEPPTPTRARRPLNATSRESLQLFRAGRSVAQIAKDRGFAIGTIYTHLENAVAAGEPLDLARLITPAERAKIEAAFAEFGFENIAGALERLGPGFEYGQLKLYRAAVASGVRV